VSAGLSAEPRARVIGTHLGFLEFVAPHERSAVALHVRALPELVELDLEDAATMARAWRDLWSSGLGNTA